MLNKSNKSKIISVVNHKGGVGKTATTINLGHALARLEKKVLLVDIDPQCNTSINMRVDLSSDAYTFTSDLLDVDTKGNVNIKPFFTHLPGMMIIGNQKKTARKEYELFFKSENGFYCLNDNIRDYARSIYDYTIIDCPPSLGTLTINSVLASDIVIIPNEAGSQHSLDGIHDVIDFVSGMCQKFKNNIKYTKILITKMDRRYSLDKSMKNLIKSIIPEENLFKTIIPVNSVIKNAVEKKTTAFMLRPGAPGASAYKELAYEIIRDCK